MAKYSVEDTTLTGIADAIRTKIGSSNSIMVQNMANEIASIQTQGKMQAKTITPTTNEQIIAPDSGYDGLSSVTVTGDINLVAENIAEGVSIFGVTGTHSGSSSGGASVETCSVTLCACPDASDNWFCYTDVDGNTVIVNNLPMGVEYNQTITMRKGAFVTERIFESGGFQYMTLSGCVEWVMTPIESISGSTSIFNITGDCSISW